MSSRGMPPGRRGLAVVAVVLGALAVVLRARRGGSGSSPAAGAPRSTPDPLRAPTPPPPRAADPRREPVAPTAAAAPAAPAAVTAIAEPPPPARVAAPPPEDAAPRRTSQPGSARPILIGLAVLAAATLAAFAATRAAGDGREPTSGVAGTQASRTSPSAPAPAPTQAEETPAAADPPRATAATTVRARGFAILQAEDAALAEFAGARVVARRARVGELAGNRIFWIGIGDERLLVHLQGPGTRWAVRTGQLVSFTAILTPTKPGAPERWGLDPDQGLAEQQRQGHHLEVYGPRMRFDCVRRCS